MNNNCCGYLLLFIVFLMQVGHSSVKLSKQVAPEENTDKLVRFGRKLLVSETKY